MKAPAPAEDDVRYNLIPTIKKFHECGAQKRCIVGPVGCYSGDTEFLSPIGWIRFDEYDGQEAAQWSAEKRSVNFVQPSEYIKEPCYDFIHFKNDLTISMVLSDEHRMPLFDEYGVLHVKKAHDIAHEIKCLDGKRWYVPQFDYGWNHQLLNLGLSKDTCSVERVKSTDGFKYCFTVE